MLHYISKKGKERKGKKEGRKKEKEKEKGREGGRKKKENRLVH